MSTSANVVELPANVNPGAIWDPSTLSDPQDYDYLKRKWFKSVPFNVVFKPDRGRFLLAKENMKAGDPVITSFPYCYAVCDDVKEYTCQYCFEEKVSEKEALPFPCKRCNQVWYCSEACKRIDSHQHKFECKTMDAFFNHIDWDDSGNRTEIRLFCRTLSRRSLEEKHINLPKDHFYSTQSDVVFDDFMKLISSRDQEAGLLESLREIVHYVVGLDKWLVGLDEEMLLDVVLKTRNNMFNIFKSSTVSLGWGVYIEASLFNHSCLPNVCLFRKHGTPEFYFVALHDIPKNCELTVTYLGYGDLDSRQSHLKEHYFFDCDCVRCREEKESVAQQKAALPAAALKKTIKLEEKKPTTPDADVTTIVPVSNSHDAWHEAFHCKNDNCLGYVVPWTYEKETPKSPQCNYCSFANEEEEQEAEEDTKSKAEGETPGANQSQKKKKKKKKKAKNPSFQQQLQQHSDQQQAQMKSEDGQS